MITCRDSVKYKQYELVKEASFKYKGALFIKTDDLLGKRYGSKVRSHVIFT